MIFLQKQLPNNYYNQFNRKYFEKRNLRKASSGLGFYIFTYILLMFIIAYVMGSVVTLANYSSLGSDKTNITSSPSYLFIEIFVPVFSALIPALFYLMISKNKMSQIIQVNHVKLKFLIPIVFIGMAVAMLANIATDAIATNFSLFGIKDTTNFDSSTNGVFSTVLSIIAICVVPAFAEEFAFRGILMGTLRKYGDAFAIIVSAVMFGAMHGNISQIPFAFILGLFFAYIDCKTNSIIPSIIIHFINNLYATIFSLINSSDIISYKKFAMISYAVMIIFCIIGVIGFFLLNKREKYFFNISDRATSLTATLSLKDKCIAFFINPGVILSLSVLLLTTLISLSIGKA